MSLGLYTIYLSVLIVLKLAEIENFHQNDI